MTAQHPRYWFHAKTYGWGWGLPATWEGWAVLTVWIVLVTVGSAWTVLLGWGWFAGFMVIMCAALVAICYAKGEPPRWRWGDDADRGDDHAARS